MKKTMAESEKKHGDAGAAYLVEIDRLKLLLA